MALAAVKSRKAVPRHYEGIVNLIAAEYPTLSGGNQQIARYFTQNPNVVGLESIHAIAAKCDVHPSSVVRFSQSLGYSGFKELQSVFQTRLAEAAPGFHERINALESDLKRNQSRGPMGFLRDLAVRDMASIQGLLESVREKMLNDAAILLTRADTIYIVGQLRSEPVAILFRYLLTMLKRRVVLLDTSGGLAQEMAHTIGPNDVLVAIAFRHYAKEVVAIAEQTTVPIIAITDSQLSPIAKNARVLFTIPEEEYSFSRSLAAPMCLVQSIATVAASLLQPNSKAAPYIPTVTEIARSGVRGSQRAPSGRMKS